jgi:hypothetical protein
LIVQVGRNLLSKMRQKTKHMAGIQQYDFLAFYVLPQQVHHKASQKCQFDI